MFFPPHKTRSHGILLIEHRSLRYSRVRKIISIFAPAFITVRAFGTSPVKLLQSLRRGFRNEGFPYGVHHLKEFSIFFFVPSDYPFTIGIFQYTVFYFISVFLQEIAVGEKLVYIPQKGGTTVKCP